jgi:ankyrin repeat protein
MTALMWAAKGGYTDIVKALVAAGADVKLKDSNQQTALYRARRTDIIDILKGAGASE